MRLIFIRKLCRPTCIAGLLSLVMALYSPLSSAVPGNVSILPSYLAKLETSIAQNEKYQCHYSGFRWQKSYLTDAYDQKNKKYYKIKENSQYYWAELQNKEVIQKEINALDDRITECKKGRNEPNIPKNGSFFQSFIPKGWKQITQKAYKDQFKEIPSGFIDFIPKPSLAKDTFSVDLNNDGIQDVITFIGRSTNTNIGFDDFRLLVLFGKTSGGFELAYAINADLDDMPPEGGFSSGRKYKFNIKHQKSPAKLYIDNTMWSEPKIGDRWVRFGFTYKNKEFVLTEYTEFDRDYEYGSKPAEKYLKRTFDFEKKSILIESSLNTLVDACILTKEQQKIARRTCPKPYKLEKELSVPNNFRLTLLDFANFKPIDFEEMYGVQLK